MLDDPSSDGPLSPEQQWIRAWRSAASKLPEIRAAELRAMTDESIVEISLMLEPFETAPFRPSSGMVELQKWFSMANTSNVAGKSEIP